MKVLPQDITAFNKAFDVEVKYLINHIREYQKELLKMTLESDNKTVNPDRQFMLELVEEGFIKTVTTYITHADKNLKGKRNWMGKVSDILNNHDSI